MQITTTQTVAPTAEPVTLEEVREHGRIDGSEEDALLTSLALAARVGVEAYLGRVLMSSTYTTTFECFPGSYGELRLPQSKWPVSSVSGVTYIDSAGDSQTLATSVYELVKGDTRGRLNLKYGQTWPSTRVHAGAENVTVTYVAGYEDAASVPDPIKTAIKMLVLELYENRQATAEARIAQNKTYQLLLDLYRLPEVA